MEVEVEDVAGEYETGVLRYADKLAYGSNRTNHHSFITLLELYLGSIFFLVLKMVDRCHGDGVGGFGVYFSWE